MRTFAQLILVSALFASANANAAILFDNGTPNLLNALISDLSGTVGFGSVIVGEDFTLATASTIDRVSWEGAYGFSLELPLPADAFSIRVFDFSGASPATTPLATFTAGSSVNRNATGQNILDFAIYGYSATGVGISLPAGRYLLSIVNDTPTSELTWFWATSTTSEPDALNRDQDSGSWSTLPTASSLAFRLESADVASEIPEPGTFVLVGLALALTGLRRPKRPVQEHHC
jgi:hypothetical protein